MQRNSIKRFFAPQKEDNTAVSNSVSKAVKAELINVENQRVDRLQFERIADYIILDDDGFVVNGDYNIQESHCDNAEYIILDENGIEINALREESSDASVNCIVLDGNAVVENSDGNRNSQSTSQNREYTGMNENDVIINVGNTDNGT